MSYQLIMASPTEISLDKQIRNNNILMVTIIAILTLGALWMISFLGRLATSIATSLLIQVGRAREITLPFER